MADEANPVALPRKNHRFLAVAIVITFLAAAVIKLGETASASMPPVDPITLILYAITYGGVFMIPALIGIVLALTANQTATRPGQSRKRRIMIAALSVVIAVAVFVLALLIYSKS